MPLAALESSWHSEAVFKRNTLYNFCAPENFLNPCNLSGTSSLTTTTYTITSSVTSVRISSDVGRPSLLIRQAKDALCYSLLHHRRSQHRHFMEHRLGKRTSDCNQRERPVAGCPRQCYLGPKFEDLPRTGTTPSQPLPHPACRENIG